MRVITRISKAELAKLYPGKRRPAKGARRGFGRVKKPRKPVKPPPCETSHHWLTHSPDGQRLEFHVLVGVETPNSANFSRQGNYRRVSKLREKQRLATMHALARLDVHDVIRAFGGWPNSLHLVRLGPGVLDPHDGLPHSQKSIVDQFVAWLACDNTPTGKGDDGPNCGIRFTYAQKKQKLHGVRLEIARLT
jgi:hypothetical protein